MNLRRPILLNRNLHPRRAPNACRPCQYPPVIGTIFEDRDLDGYALDLFIADREQLPFAVGKRLRDVAGYRAANSMGFGCFFAFVPRY